MVLSGRMGFMVSLCFCVFFPAADHVVYKSVSIDRNWAAGSVTHSLDQSERFWYCSSKHIMHFRRVTPGKKYQYLKSVCLLVHCG